MQTLKIRAVQSDILWEDPQGNLDKLSQLLKEAAPGELVVLPEMFATGFSMRPEKIAQSTAGDIVSWMRENSADKLVCGTVAIEEEGRYFNRFLACFEGEVIATYDKRHLFSYAGEDKHYTAGNSLSVFEYKGWKIKPLICYDLRFPVWSRNTEAADLMIYCANWPKVRIQAWNALLPARAIENQCFVLGVNRVGVDGNANEYDGNSALLDPLGERVFELQDLEQTKFYLLQKTDINSVRKNYPFLYDADEFKILF
jgi:predicted amidohydrolase